MSWCWRGCRWPLLRSPPTPSKWRPLARPPRWRHVRLPSRGGEEGEFVFEGDRTMIRALGPSSVSSFLKVILDVFYYVLFTVAVLVAVSILALLLISFNPQVLPASVLTQAKIVGHPPGVPAAVLLAGAELSVVGVIVIVQRLRRIFGAL